MPEKRQAPRVPFEAPAYLPSTRGTVEAKSVDLSRSGLRLLASRRALGAGLCKGLAELTHCLRAVLGSCFSLELGAGPAERRLSKAVELKRLVQLPDSDLLELGCAFEVALRDSEVEALGVSFPAVSEGQSLASTPWRRPKGRTLRVFVSSNKKDGPPPLQGNLQGLTRQALSTRLPLQSLPGNSLDLALAAAEFSARFGEQLSVRIMEGPKNLWTGPARVEGLELPSDESGPLLLILSYGRKLRSAEIARLGLG